MSLTLLDTPIEKYDDIYVKREDLCAPPGAPPFSKIRGVVKHLEQLKQQGYIGVTYVETSVSMAGWGLAWACNQMGMKCIIFNPIYKKPPPLLLFHREQWRRWGAELRDIPAGRAKVNYYIARKQTPRGFKLLPLGLPLPESVSATYSIANSCISVYNSIVVCVGSGTIASGLFRATSPKQVLYGVMSRTGNTEAKAQHIVGATLFPGTKGVLEVIDPGWEYAEACSASVPFPCHPYYDLKAWDWLVQHEKEIRHPILFWNIGSTGEFGAVEKTEEPHSGKLCGDKIRRK